MTHACLGPGPTGPKALWGDIDAADVSGRVSDMAWARPKSEISSVEAAKAAVPSVHQARGGSWAIVDVTGKGPCRIAANDWLAKRLLLPEASHPLGSLYCPLLPA